MVGVLDVSPSLIFAVPGVNILYTAQLTTLCRALQKCFGVPHQDALDGAGVEIPQY